MNVCQFQRCEMWLTCCQRIQLELFKMTATHPSKRVKHFIQMTAGLQIPRTQLWRATDVNVAWRLLHRTAVSEQDFAQLTCLLYRLLSLLVCSLFPSVFIAPPHMQHEPNLQNIWTVPPLMVACLTPEIEVLLEKLVVTKLDKKFSVFTEQAGSLPCSKHHAICHYHEPHESYPQPLILFFKIYFNIVLPSTPSPSQWSVSLIRPHQHPVCILFVSQSTTCPPSPVSSFSIGYSI